MAHSSTGANKLGVWARDPRAWSWLSATLGSALLRTLLHEAAGLAPRRHELPALHAVHFVIVGLPGRVGSSNLRAEQTDKAVGEVVPAKDVFAPLTLLRQLGLGLGLGLGLEA